MKWKSESGNVKLDLRTTRLNGWCSVDQGTSQNAWRKSLLRLYPASRLKLQGCFTLSMASLVIRERLVRMWLRRQLCLSRNRAVFGYRWCSTLLSVCYEILVDTWWPFGLYAPDHSSTHTPDFCIRSRLLFRDLRWNTNLLKKVPTPFRNH